MNAKEMIQINRLLRQREEIYADILESEEKIQDALDGGSYPLPKPPEVPSIFRSAKKSSKKRIKVKQIRKLKRTEENAYKITFMLNHEPHSDFIRDVRLVRRLQTFSIPFFELLKVETVQIKSNTEVQTVDLLYIKSNQLESLQ